MGFLTDLGRKLCDLLISSDGSKQDFFNFVELKDSFHKSKFTLFGLRLLKAEAEEAGEPNPLVAELHTTLMQVQQTLLNYFLDRFRSLTHQTESILQSIPRHWYLPEICR